MELSEQVLATIQKEHIKPRSRQVVFLYRSVYWGLVVVALGVGAVAYSITIFSLTNTEWDIWQRTLGGGWRVFLSALPYAWLVIFAGFVWFAYFSLRHTRFGYRFSLIKAILIYLIMTTALGALLYRAGIGGQLEEFVAEHAPYYYQLPGGHMIWQLPERGTLGGRIVHLTEPQNFILIDQNGFEWRVTVSGTMADDWNYEGAKIKIIGEKFGTSSFRALEVRSWCGCGGCLTNAPGHPATCGR